MLTQEQRQELETMGATNVRFRLSQFGGGRASAIPGFKCGDMTRGDIEDWLAEKYVEEVRMQRWTLVWAMVGGVAGTLGVLIALFK